MMGILEEIASIGGSYSRDESLSSFLKDIMTQQLTDHPSPKKYYYLTQLTNPVQTFYSRLNPEMIKSRELARKLARGTQLHGFASAWFRPHPDFVNEEATIDGVWVGIPGVRGKIDFKFKDSIMEFKTKDSIPPTIEEIFSKYPNDLEQLVFYSVLHPSSPKINYLVFMENMDPYSIVVFRVTTNDNGKIKTLIKKRITDLNNAFKSEDPTYLGKCRYHGSSCQFHENSNCSCDELEPLTIEPIRESITIEHDPDFSLELNKLREAYGSFDSSHFTTNEIILPRKRLMNTVYGIESNYSGDDIEQYRACLWSSMNILKNRLEINISSTERREIIESQKESRVRVGFRWLKLKSSSNPEGQLVPYLLKISMSSYRNSPLTLPDYNRAELGIVCSVYGKDTGLIFKVFPELDKLVQVYQVTYKSPKQILKKVRELLDETERAEKENDLLSLPPCPPYMNENKTCPLLKECNTDLKSGCLD